VSPDQQAAEIRERADEAVVTKHAKRRMRERLKIPYGAATRCARMAASRGTPYMIPHEGEPNIAFVLGDAVWVFTLKSSGPVAVTVLHWQKLSSDQMAHLRPLSAGVAHG
jgi:hypothetical protein